MDWHYLFPISEQESYYLSNLRIYLDLNLKMMSTFLRYVTSIKSFTKHGNLIEPGYLNMIKGIV